MTSDIENLLADLRDPRPVDPPTTPDRRRIVIATGAIGILSVLLTVGALAFGVPGTLADPQPIGDSLGGDLLESSATPSPEAAPVSTPTATPETPSDVAVSTTFDVTTDVTTIPIPADFPPEEVENARIWLTQQSIVAQCMQEQGFHFTYTPWWLRAPNAPLGPAAGEGPGTAFWTARWGPDDQPFGDDYDWKQAGCAGYAVHVTGMDGQH